MERTSSDFHKGHSFRDSSLRDFVWYLPLVALHWISGFGRWNHFYWDTAREIVLPRRILAGDLPFRDFEVLYGPLPYHITAIFLRWFGNHLWVDRMVNALLLLATLLVLSRVAQLWGLRRPWRIALGFSYLALFAFPIHAFCLFSFMMPHCQSGVYQPLFQLLILWCVAMFLERGEARYSWMACLICGLSPLFVRLDCVFGMVFFGLVAILLPFTRVREGTSGSATVSALVGCAFLMLPIGIWVLWMNSMVPFPLLIERISEIRFFLRTATADTFVWKAFFRAGIFAVSILLGSFFWTQFSSHPRRWAAIFILIASGVWGLTGHTRTLSDQYYFILMAFSFWAAAWYSLKLLVHRTPESWRNAILSIAGCMFIARSFSSGYGLISIVYAGTPLLLTVFVLAQGVQGFSLGANRSKIFGWTVGSCWVSGLVLMTFFGVKSYQARTVRVATEWGTVWLGHSEKERLLQSAAERLRPLVGRDERIYSYSPNFDIYALASRLPVEYDQDGVRWKSEASNGMLVSFAEERMISILEKHHVRWIVLDNSAFPTHVYRTIAALYGKKLLKHPDLYFGRDEAPMLANWIEERFETVYHWGDALAPSAANYGISILRRREINPQL